MEQNVNERKIQDGHLAAILDDGSRPKSLGHSPGGHIGRRIETKIDRAPPLMHTIKTVKYEVD
jgi:hypothetical protein